MKYVLIEPNQNLIPNNILNKRAAKHYHYHRENYHQLLIKNDPESLSMTVCNNFNKDSMDIE
jgi:hypothetical protein